MANPSTLWEFYQQKGQSLPSLSERAKLYESLGLGSASNYVGTGDQNTALLGKLATTQPIIPKVSPSGTPYPLTSTGQVPTMPSGAPVPVPTVSGKTVSPEMEKQIKLNSMAASLVKTEADVLKSKTVKPLTSTEAKPIGVYTDKSYGKISAGGQWIYQKVDKGPGIIAGEWVPYAGAGKTEPTSGPDYYYTQVLKNPTATAEAKAEATAYFARKNATLETIGAGVAEVGTGIASLKERIATEGITGPGGVVLQAPTKGVATSEVPRAEEAKTISEQAAAEVAEEKEITTLQRARTIAELKSQLGIDTGIPVRPSFATDFEALRSEEGMSALEGQINSLESQIRDTEASLRQGLYTEEGQLRPMELIGTRQRELTRQAQEQMDTLNRRKTTLVDEYNTKVDLVNNIMKLKTMDYANAVDEYNTKFSQAITMQNLMMNMDEKARAEETAFRDDARANWTLLMNTAREQGKSYADMDPMMQLTAKKLELQGELPVGISEFYMANKPDAEVLWEGKSVDAEGKEIVTFIYKNAEGKVGASEVVYTGGVSLPAGVSSASAEDTNRINAINEFINKNVGEDQYISAQTWLQARMQWAAMGGTPSQYDDLYNPALLMGDWEWSKLPLEMQPKGATKQFLTQDYFTDTFTNSQLDKAAKAAGYKSWTGRVGEEHRKEYITYLITKYIPQQRKNYSDEQILAEITKTME